MMKGQYMLIWTYSDSGRLNHDWYKSEADALQNLLNTLPTWWMIVGVGEDGTQREPNHYPIIIRSSFSKVNEDE